MRGGGGTRRTVRHVPKSWIVVLACAFLSPAIVSAAAGAQGGVELGPETSLGARIPSAEPGGQLWPAIAHGDGSSVAVWEQRPEGLEDSTIVARHLDDRGVPVEEAATVVARGATSTMPDVAFGGGTYLVAFADAGAVRAVGLDERGRPVDGTPITVATVRDIANIEVVRLGDAFAVTWADNDEYRSPSRYAAIVDPNGEPRTSTPELLVADAAGSVVAGPPGELLVLWSDHSRADSGIDSFGRRFDVELQPIGERFVVSDAEGTQEAADAVFDGEAYRVAWSDSRAYPDTQIRVATMSAEGSIGESRVAGTHGYFTGDIDLGKTAETYVVLWGEVDDDRIHARRFASDGTFTGPEAFTAYTDVSEGVTYDFDVAGTPEGAILLVDGVDPDLGDNVFSVWLDADGGGPGPRALVSRAANGQRTPAVAGNGSGALVVWQDWRTTAWEEHFDSGTPEERVDVYAARLTPSGLVPRDGIRVSTGDKMEAHPAVAWTGRSYLAAWSDHASGEVRLRTIARDGELGRTRGLSGRGSYNVVPRVAGIGGRGYLVWFNEYTGFPDDPSIMGVPVNRKGGTGTPRTLFDGEVSAWDVGAAARRFVVAWVGNDLLYTRTFSARGVPLSKRRVVASAPFGRSLRIGSGAGRLLVTWRGSPDVETEYEVYSMVLDSRGRRVTEPRSIGSAPTSGAEVLWDGAHFVVAWHKLTDPEAHALEAVKVDGSGGAVAGREALDLGRVFRSYTQLGVALRDGEPIVVYERHAPEPLFGGVSRIFLRALR